jgi:amidase
MTILHDTARAFVPYPEVAVPHASTGPLTGLSFAVKDLFDVAGYPTGGGQPLLLAMSGIKTKTAPTVSRLLDAGARMVGKTVTDELAFSMNGQNAHFGNPINGAAPDRISGGSSSGSAAAVSNHLCDFALGTDTGGSVRAPANHCGLVGLRPSHGRVSLAGALDLAPSFDTCCWFSRDIQTFARVGDVLLGADTHPLPAHIRLIRPTAVWSLLSGEVAATLAPCVSHAQDLLGHAIDVAGFPSDFDALYWNFRYIQGREAWQVDGGFIERYAPPLGPGVRERFEWSKAVTDEQVVRARTYRGELTRQLSDLLGQDGVMLLPTMPDVAPLISQDAASLEDYRNRGIQMLSISGMTGFPQLSLPMAKRLGAPLGFSLLGPAGSDRSLIALAERLMASS